MSVLHNSYYFSLKKSQLKNRQKSAEAATPEPLKIKKFALFNHPVKRPLTSHKLHHENKAKTSPEQNVDSFSFYIENYALTNLPPFEIIEHFNGRKTENKRVKKYLRIPQDAGMKKVFDEDFSLSKLPQLENELFDKPLKKKIKPIIKLAKRSKNNFEVIGNPLSLLSKQSTKVKKNRIKSRIADIHFRCPEVKLSKSFSIKDEL
jgi:hypothetical protein